MKIWACLFLLLLTVSCGKRSPAGVSSRELTGSREERVQKYPKAPSALRDARGLDVQIGDGRLGPSDFQHFRAFEVAPVDLQRWTAGLTPLTSTPPYVRPSAPVEWWVSAERFSSLRFFDLKAVSGAAEFWSKLLPGQGWIGVSALDGKIFVYAHSS